MQAHLQYMCAVHPSTQKLAENVRVIECEDKNVGVCSMGLATKYNEWSCYHDRAISHGRQEKEKISSEDLRKSWGRCEEHHLQSD